MILKKLNLIHFKNFLELEIDFCPGINILIGNNGIGKTTILEAIYYMSFCKSFLNSYDSQIIHYNKNFFIIQGIYEENFKEINIHCGIKKGEKKSFKKNKKEYNKLSDHIGKIPLIIISPSDSEFITSGSSARRKFIDGMISQHNKKYLEAILTYQKILQQRNTLLKSMYEQKYFDEESLSIWDVQLEQYTNYIYQERKKIIREFIPLFEKFYSTLSINQNKMNIYYKSKIEHNSIIDLLKKSREKDKTLKHTTEGIHKDDIDCLIDDMPIKKYGSQGQQKTFLIALKLAQFVYIKNKKQQQPILLLDDIFDKLDSNKVRLLMNLVQEHTFGQTFITDSNKQRIKDLFRGINENIQLFQIHSPENIIKTIINK